MILTDLSRARIYNRLYSLTKCLIKRNKIINL